MAQYRRELCRLLWRLWSPTWDFKDEVFDRTAVSFDNPDFVDVVIHSYRHRFGLVSGDPSVEETEKLLMRQPKISVPTIAMPIALFLQVAQSIIIVFLREPMSAE